MARKVSTLLCLVLVLGLCVLFAGQARRSLSPLAYAKPAKTEHATKEVASQLVGPANPDARAGKQPQVESKSSTSETPQAAPGSSIAVTVTVVNFTTGGEEILPNSFFLDQNLPNPFNASTVITYGVGERRHVQIDVYNILGQQVTTLVSATQAAGRYDVTWNPGELGSGVYFCRMVAGTFRRTRHMLQLK